jgi:hypothetical protein
VRTPKARGKPIDGQRLRSWIRRFDGYRVAITEERVGNWFSNFQEHDKELGARVLDSVTFLKSEDMDTALRSAAARLPGWNKNPPERRGKWRFVAFSSSAGESGDTILHRFRTALGLTAGQFSDLFIYKAELMRQGMGAEDSVVFVDDFAGTGEQACRAWRGDVKTGMTGLAELLPEKPKTYLILIAAGKRAVDRITQETGLKVITRHLLYSGDNIFSVECQHFSSTEKDCLLEYCKRADRKIPRGYGECGFVIVLAHKTPNNSIPVLHANHYRWRGLFPRH